MKTVTAAAKHLENLEPYDPRYLPARIYLNANENPFGMLNSARQSLLGAIADEPLHRYPDPLAKQLRNALAAKLNIKNECVLLGNGGDELLFDICLAYGGEGRALLTTPPTFSVYGTDALLSGTKLIEVPRNTGLNAEGLLDFCIDEDAVLSKIKSETPHLIILTTPNNPTGDCLTLSFIERVLNATDAVVVIDHAYIEFSNPSYDATSLLAEHENLAILRTFSKAYGLAGMRIGYLTASKEIIRQLCKVRQPYSVDTLSAIAALGSLAEEDEALCRINILISERRRITEALSSDKFGLAVAPSEANYLLVRVPSAHEVWLRLYEEYGILVRDLSHTPGLEDCLRVSVGTPEENNEFLMALATILESSFTLNADE